MKNMNNWITKSLLILASSLYLLSCSFVDDQQEVKLTAISSIERVFLNAQVLGESQVDIKAAKNEYESFQIAVSALSKNVQVVNAELSDLSGDAGVIKKENFTLFRPEYIHIKNSSPRAQLPHGLYTDPLIPFNNPQTGEIIKPFRIYQEYWPGPLITEGHEIYPLPFEVWKGQSKPIWVDIYVPTDASPGEYTGTFTVTLNNFPSPAGLNPDTVINKIVTLPVKLTVWDFTLPDGPSHRNHFGGVGNISNIYDVEQDSDKYNDIVMNYTQMFSDHRLNPPLPRSLMPVMNNDGSLSINEDNHDKLKKFIEDFHVTDFEIPRPSIPGINNPHRPLQSAETKMIYNYYRDFYRYLVDNDWDSRSYVYLYDEPNTKECYTRVLELGKIVREAAPELKVLVVEQPYTQDPEWPDMDPVVDIWCGLLGFIDRDSINAAIERGDEVWSYSALCQRAPGYHPNYDKVKNYDPPYWQIDAPLSSFRVPTWINYQYDISGILYWALTFNEKGGWDPTFRLRFNGDGYFMYPGTPCGIDGPISSIRLKNLRESMEDYEYFVLYEKLAGRDAVMNVISEIAPEWWSATNDPKAILTAREKIANEIIKLKD